MRAIVGLALAWGGTALLLVAHVGIDVWGLAFAPLFTVWCLEPLR
jgi:hypothetical protein